MSGVGPRDRRRGHAVVVRRADRPDRNGLRSAARTADRGRLPFGERGLVLLDAPTQTAVALGDFARFAVLAFTPGGGRGRR